VEAAQVVQAVAAANIVAMEIELAEVRQALQLRSNRNSNSDETQIVIISSS